MKNLFKKILLAKIPNWLLFIIVIISVFGSITTGIIIGVNHYAESFWWDVLAGFIGSVGPGIVVAWLLYRKDNGLNH